MGQPVTVIESPSSTPGIVRFDTNRPLSGTGHEIYSSIDDIEANRPVDRVARAVFEWSDEVESVHINSNVVTVRLGTIDSSGLKKAIEDVFLFYRD